MQNGGETRFPASGVSVAPKRGRVAVFQSTTPEGFCDERSRHSAAAVAGDVPKTAVQKWYLSQPLPNSRGGGVSAESAMKGWRHIRAVIKEEDRSFVVCEGSGSCREYLPGVNAAAVEAGAAAGAGGAAAESKDEL